jgi:aerobic C4-dicarboxylate transport protein
MIVQHKSFLVQFAVRLFGRLFRLFSTHLYVVVLAATLFGGLLGYFEPTLGQSLKPLGEIFIQLVKIFIGPIIFCTIVTGIAGAGDMKKVGRIGAKALVYFEIVSTVSLLLGLLAVNLLQPGRGFNADPTTLDSSLTGQFAHKASEQTTIDFIMHIFPKTFFDAFTGNGDLLQVILISILFGWALNHTGPKARPVFDLIEMISSVLFTIISGIMKLAPLGAAGAMAFTVGKYGVASLVPLASLLGAFYLTCAVFVFAILGSISATVGFNIFYLLRYIRAELALVLATSSSESALVPLMRKLERLGCPKSVVGLVIPSGYSFNLDGTNIYLTLAAIFIAQACNIDLTLKQQLSLMAVAVVTSKGASGVTGAGFITLAATLAVVPQVPLAGLALILGVDRFMSEGRAITNVIGNGVATIVISKWEGELDIVQLKRELKSKVDLGFES